MDSLFKFVRKLLALPFLPPEHIQETFQRLDEEAPRPLLQWRTMSTGLHDGHQNKKWHVGIAQHTKNRRGPVAFYHIVSVLYGEAIDISLNMKMVSEGKMQQYHRKKPRQMEGWVFGLWQLYCERNINASQTTSSVMYHRLCDTTFSDCFLVYQCILLILYILYTLYTGIFICKI